MAGRGWPLASKFLFLKCRCCQGHSRLTPLRGIPLGGPSPNLGTHITRDQKNQKRIVLHQVHNVTPPSKAFPLAQIIILEWLSQQNLQSRNLLTPLAPSGRHETVDGAHQRPRSQSAQELVGLEFLDWSNTNETTLNQNSPPCPENNGCP